MEPYYDNWNFFTPIDLLPWSDLLSPLCKRTSPLQCFQTGVGQYSVCLFNGSINLCWLTPWIVWLIPLENPPVTGGKPEGFGQFHRYRGKTPINGGPGSPVSVTESIRDEPRYRAAIAANNKTYLQRFHFWLVALISQNLLCQNSLLLISL